MGFGPRSGSLNRAIDRFHVAQAPAGVRVEGPCWLYSGRLNGKGYGPHRESYEARRGAIPIGMVLDHLCRRRDCIQPLHLEPVTQSANERRKPSKARELLAKVCPRGHALVGANRVVGGGCRACNS